MPSSFSTVAAWRLSAEGSVLLSVESSGLRLQMLIMPTALANAISSH
jgi:hypothetical protein